MYMADRILSTSGRGVYFVSLVLEEVEAAIPLRGQIQHRR